ncbi:MAG: PspC domain-containing protein [Flavobacteriales bacterium]|nr:PspC domain-containing protein [Flavobacteriales bacterium]
MNKTITSNIAGYVFHIDENAYEKLEAYLNTIRSYFSESQGRDEIITDIEARLAEMLHERIGDMKQVVTLADVNHVIQVMGQPEAFLEDDPEEATWSEKNSSRSAGPRKLFRDPDNRIVGGVCSGVSSYLGIDDPIWLRLALALTIIFFGTGAFIYFILWIIMPEAKTTAEKLQMRGESVTVSNIEKRVNEELETVKNKWNDLHGNSHGGRRVGNAIHRALTLLGSLAVLILKFFAKIFGFVFLVGGVTGFAALVALGFGFPTIISLSNDGLISSIEAQQILHNIVGGTGMMAFIYLALILIYGIPLLALTYVGLRLLFNLRRRPRGIGLAFVSLWIIGLIMSLAIGGIIATDFISEGIDTETVELNLTTDPDRVIHLGMNNSLGDDEPTFGVDIFNLDLMMAPNSDRIYGKPELDINIAKTGGPKLVIKRSARANKKQEAMQRANKIDYGFVASDTSILFNGYFTIPEEELWRTQELDLELLLPVGYTIYLSDDMMRIIYDIDNVTNTRDSKMVGRRWIMTPDGLACVDCEGLDDPKTSVHSGVHLDVDVNIRQLEDKERELERAKEELEREMEKLQEELDKEREDKEEDVDEEASSDSQEILLKRVINATYQVGSSLYRSVQISYPG